MDDPSTIINNYDVLAAQCLITMSKELPCLITMSKESPSEYGRSSSSSSSSSSFQGDEPSFVSDEEYPTDKKKIEIRNSITSSSTTTTTACLHHYSHDNMILANQLPDPILWKSAKYAATPWYEYHEVFKKGTRTTHCQPTPSIIFIEFHSLLILFFIAR